MTNKEYLMQYKTCQSKIAQAKESLAGLIESIDSMSVDYSGMPKGSGISNRPEQYVLSVEGAIQERRRQIEKWRETMTAIENAIMDIDDPMYSRVLWLRYVKGWAWEDIADDQQVMLSVDHVCSRFHGRALQRIVQR